MLCFRPSNPRAEPLIKGKMNRPIFTLLSVMRRWPYYNIIYLANKSAGYLAKFKFQFVSNCLAYDCLLLQHVNMHILKIICSSGFKLNWVFVFHLTIITRDHSLGFTKHFYTLFPLVKGIWSNKYLIMVAVQVFSSLSKRRTWGLSTSEIIIPGRGSVYMWERNLAIVTRIRRLLATK